MSYSVDFRHTLYYSNRELLPVSEVASAMVAFSRLVHSSTPAIQKVLNCPDLIDVQVYLERLLPGSTDETFVHRFAFKSKKSYDDFVAFIRKVTGVQYVEEKNPVLGSLYALILVGAATFAVGRWGVDGGPHIENVSNSILNVGAGSLNIPPAELQKMVFDAMPNKAVAASNAVKIIRPAKFEPGAKITFDNRPDLVVTSEAIKEVPAVPGEADDTRLQTALLTNTLIDIRALDRDNKTKGWAAIVPGFSARRAKMEVGPSIDQSDLIGKTNVTGDVEITFRTNARGVDVPKRIFLNSIK